MFWIIATFLTALCMVIVAVPYLRGRRAVRAELAYDREIYRARLEEIETDRRLGRISEDEAKAATAEEGRRLIAVANSTDRREMSERRGTAMPLLAALVAVPALAFAGYLSSGVPGMPDMAIADRANTELSQQSVQELLSRAEAHLNSEPEDLRGWTVIAPIYLRMGRAGDAISAYRNAVRLAPDDPQLKAALAEAMVVSQQGIVTREAETLFKEALQTQPNAARPRFYLAIALSQQGEFEAAAAAWRELLADAPQNAPWLETARAQLAAVEQNLPGGTRPSGPTQADIEAAARMSDEERQEMIRSMVDGLAERLARDPADRQGWRRLLHAYKVLGQPDEVNAALQRARNHFGSDTQFMAELESIAGAADSAADTEKDGQ